MAKKQHTIIEIDDLLKAALLLEDKEAQAKELQRIAELELVKDEAERAAIEEKIKAAFETAGVAPPEPEKEEEGEMVKVKILQSVGTLTNSYSAGQIIDLPAIEAESWIKHKLAEKV